MSNNSPEAVVKKVVVVFAIFGGLFFASRKNPESELYNVLIELLKRTNPETGFIWVFYVIPIVVTISTILYAYSKGGGGGVIAIAVGFLGGAFLVWMKEIGVLLCTLAIYIGFKVFSSED